MYNIDSPWCQSCLKSWKGGISKNKLWCELWLENKLWTGCHSKVEENICNGYGRKKKKKTFGIHWKMVFLRTGVISLERKKCVRTWMTV